jgi:hypothetical protein
MSSSHNNSGMSWFGVGLLRPLLNRCPAFFFSSKKTFSSTKNLTNYGPFKGGMGKPGANQTKGQEDIAQKELTLSHKVRFSEFL